MKYIFYYLIGCLLITALATCKKTDVTSGNDDPAEEDTTGESSTEDFYRDYAIKNLPDPPSGKKWVVDESTTDEFDEDTLNSDKWGNFLPNWKGRPPGYFLRENVSVKDGKLQITNTWLEEEIEDNGNTYTIGTGAVRSQNSIIFPVYTEARMKASNVPLSSTFWLMSENSGTLSGCITYNTELDIIETVGGPYSWDEPIESFNTKLHSNTHFRTRDCGSPETFYSAGPDELVELGYKTHEEYHTYGVYWIDATQARIYIDGILVYTLQFDNSQKSNPFDLPMNLRMVTETYNWLKPPSKEMLEDDSRNSTTHYEWVRTYKLESK